MLDRGRLRRGRALARETDAGLVLIDGHLRAEIADDQELPVLVLDVSAEEADKILATFDPLTGMAEEDRRSAASHCCANCVNLKGPGPESRIPTTCSSIWDDEAEAADPEDPRTTATMTPTASTC